MLKCTIVSLLLTVALGCTAPNAPTAPAAAGKTAEALACSPNPSGAFNIELVYVDRFTTTEQRTIRNAADRWEEAIVGDLPNVRINFNRWDSFLGRRLQSTGVVDDLRIILVKKDMTGQTAAASAVRIVRSDSRLPALAVLVVDTAEIARGRQADWYYKIVLHEMGHSLGFGTAWEQPTVAMVSCDLNNPHFLGPAARLGFDLLGGRSFAGAKVPLTDDKGHWRDQVFGDELMVAVALPSDTMPLSAITLGSMADLGYQVDYSAADAYEVPDSTAENTAAGKAVAHSHAGHALSAGMPIEAVEGME